MVFSDGFETDDGFPVRRPRPGGAAEPLDRTLAMPAGGKKTLARENPLRFPG
jgi:hypothetical protein